MTNYYFQEVINNVMSNIEFASRSTDCPVTDLLTSCIDTLGLLAHISEKEGIEPKK